MTSISEKHKKQLIGIDGTYAVTENQSGGKVQSAITKNLIKWQKEFSFITYYTYN